MVGTFAGYYRNPLIFAHHSWSSSYARKICAAGVIALMVAISTLNFIQEARSTKAADALKAMAVIPRRYCGVINDKAKWLAEIPIDQLVPGDIIKLAGI